MSRRTLAGLDVFGAAYDRLLGLYQSGATVVVSFSSGKDSTILLEMALLAAKAADRLPVNVMMRDEEILFPGSYEYAERVAARPDVRFRWFVCQQPIINIFNRGAPYWWVMDPLLKPEQWVRQPPAFAEFIDDKAIDSLVTRARFPGEKLVSLIGLRAQESALRRMGLFSSGGWMRKGTKYVDGIGRPIYDWLDGDVWKAIHDYGWDYNRAYDVMAKMGVRASKLRIAPPTLNIHSLDLLRVAMQAWPRWFDRVATRLPGIRTAALFGKRSVTASRRTGETWESCYQRTCIDEAPDWIADRCRVARDHMLALHRKHATTPFPDVKPCYRCSEPLGSWKRLADIGFTGDPFQSKWKFLPCLEPEFFRAGAGKWWGRPSF